MAKFIVKSEISYRAQFECEAKDQEEALNKAWNSDDPDDWMPLDTVLMERPNAYVFEVPQHDIKQEK